MVRFVCGDNGMSFGVRSKQSPIFNRRPPQARLTAEPKLLIGYEKARLGLETQRSQTEGVIPISSQWDSGELRAPSRRWSGEHTTEVALSW